MTRSLALLVSTALLVLAAAPAAHADALVAFAPGARNVAQAAGYTVWAVPNGARWRLVVRRPDGVVTRPDVPSFGAAPDPSVAATRLPNAPVLVPYVVYSRCAGASTTSGCDVFRLDLPAGPERRVPAAATARYSETAPGVAGERLTFVRRGAVPAARKGVFAVRTDRATPPQRVSATLAGETATNRTRVAYTGRRTVVVRRISEPTEGTFVFGGEDGPRSLVLTRYRAGWLLDGGRVRQTDRFAGSGGPYVDIGVQNGRRTLPDDTNSIALFGDRIGLYVDAEGLRTASPLPFRG